VGTTTPAQRLQAQWIPTIGDAFIDTVPAAVISSGTPDVAMIILELVAHHNFVKKHEQHRRSPHGLWLPPPPLTPAGVVV
jgi:hypothetical protein